MLDPKWKDTGEIHTQAHILSPSYEGDTWAHSFLQQSKKE